MKNDIVPIDKNTNKPSRNSFDIEIQGKPKWSQKYRIEGAKMDQYTIVF